VKACIDAPHPALNPLRSSERRDYDPGAGVVTPKHACVPEVSE
jgi:hypothetical protein